MLHSKGALIVASMLFVCLLCTPLVAYAQFEAAQSAANAVLAFMTGTFAKVLAAIGVVACGYLALAGRLQMRTALQIALGILVIFGAPQIVTLLIGFAKQ